MANFFGTVQGGRGKATRLGHHSTGLRVTAQSYSGSIIIQFYYNDVDQMECCDVELGNGSTSGGSYTLYSGPIKDLFNDQVTLGGNGFTARRIA